MVAYSSLAHLYGHLMAAVDVETTGRDPSWHEVIQIAVVPLDSDCKPLKDVKPFYENIAPEFPERAERGASVVHGMNVFELAQNAPSAGRVAEMLSEWHEQLNLYHGRTIVPLAHNWAFESSFLHSWLGIDEKDRLFHGHARDTMLFAASINDRCATRGEFIPFTRLGLESISRKLGVVNSKAHDAYADCVCEAEVYRQLLRMDF